MRMVPEHIPRPPYVGGSPPHNMPALELHDGKGINAMRRAGRLSAEVLDFAGSLVKPGVTTDEIDELVHEFIVTRDAYPSPLGYGNFPKSVCTSVNEVVCHGIPDSRPLEDGDIVSIDVSCFLDGHHGDNCRTFYCGNVSDEAKQLVEVTKEALDAAIAICGPGVPYHLIGEKIQSKADQFGYSVIRNYTGHGIGSTFHTLPYILHFASPPYSSMVAGTTFTIEPMISAGSHENHVLRDDWTVVSNDLSLCAQFEHTLLVTDDGVDVLTAYEPFAEVEE